MIRPAIKWMGPFLAVSLGLTAVGVLGLGGCAGRGLERYPPAIDHDQLEVRMAYIRMQQYEQERRQMQGRLDYVDLDPHGIRAQGGRIQAMQRRAELAKEYREEQFRELAASAEREGHIALADRSGEYAYLLKVIAQGEARIERQRAVRQARTELAIQRANEIAMERQRVIDLRRNAAQ